MEIRRLAKKDAKAYWHLRLEALEQEPHAFIESAAEHRATTIDSVKERLVPDRTGHSFVLGAFNERQMVGTAGFFREKHLNTRHKGLIWGVYIKKEFRGQGLARTLFQELLRQARAQPGLEQINIAVSSGNAAARGLYSSLGFQLYGCEPRALKVGDRYIDEEQMVLRLVQQGR